MLVGGRTRSVKKILHINNELLKLFDVQLLHREVGLAQEEVLVVGGEGYQRSGLQAGSALNGLQ